MLRLSIQGADQIADEVWRVQLDPSELRLLGPCSDTHGRVSVILVTTAAGRSDDKLEFEARYAHVLNIGASSEAIVVFDPESEVARDVSEPSSPPPLAAVHTPGDQAFLRDLPDGLRSLGEELLTRVRKQFPGRLVYYPDSGRYVEKPDNFWTVRIQPRVKDLEITVRGVPEHFVVPDGIELKPHMHGYSSFKISRSDQVPGALSILTQARKK